MDAGRFLVLRQAQDEVFLLPSSRVLRMRCAVHATSGELTLPLRRSGRVVELDAPALCHRIAPQHQKAEAVNGESVLHADAGMTLEDGAAKIGRRWVETVAAMTGDNLRRQPGGVVDGLEGMDMPRQHE